MAALSIAAPRIPEPASGPLRLSELLSALSHALDLTEGQPDGHCVRCCWIGTAVGRELGLSEARLWELYYTLLLKDLGCSSNAARICQLYLSDDRSFKHDFKTIGTSLPQVLRFILSHTGMRAGLAERFRAMINVVQNGGAIARELIDTRCHRGADIARKLRFSEEVAGAIENLDEHWDGGGLPDRKRGDEIPLFAQVALLAQVADVFHASAGQAPTVEEIRRRTGSWFGPDVADAFHAAASRPGFWETIRSPSIESIILDLEPAQHAAIPDDDYLDDIAAAFAQVVDSKSPWTSGHSSRVALFTDLIAEARGLPADHRRWLKRAALLHDIGKLGVSNMILDKAGKLDDEEWRQMREHPRLGEVILSRIGAFHELAVTAGTHHERLDGKGYPYGLKGDQIPTNTRIVTTADIFDALTAERPYRPAMPVGEALAIMARDVGTAIDPVCFDALTSGLRRVPSVT